MSKAFVKEDSEVSPEVLPDREISPHANLVTAEGLTQMEITIANLQRNRLTAQLSHLPSRVTYGTGSRSAPRRNSFHILTHRRCSSAPG